MKDVSIRELEATLKPIAAEKIRNLLSSGEFDDAVVTRRVNGWPMAVISAGLEDAIRAAGAVTTAQIVTSAVIAKKFRKRPELDADHLRQVQDALDYGEVLVEAPQGTHVTQGMGHTLIAYCEDSKTRSWWRHAIRIKK